MEAMFIVRLAMGDLTRRELADSIGIRSKDKLNSIRGLKSQLVKRRFRIWTNDERLSLDEQQAACVRAAYDGGCVND